MVETEKQTDEYKKSLEEKRKIMLDNLARGRATRKANLEKQRNKAGKKLVEKDLKDKMPIVEEKKENITLEKVERNVEENEKAVEKPVEREKRFKCLCGKQYVQKKTLIAHQNKCKYYIEKSKQIAEEDAEMRLIAQERLRKKKSIVPQPVAKQEESEEEESEEEEETKPPPPPPPSPKLKRTKFSKNIVPSAHTKHHNIPPNHFEQEEKYTLAQFRSIMERENEKKRKDDEEKQKQLQNAKLQGFINAMKSGGL